MLTPHTGNPPTRKSLSSEDVENEERVSSRNEVKQGSWVTATFLKACVILIPPSKNNGDARVPSQVVTVDVGFATAQEAEAPQTVVASWRSLRFVSEQAPLAGFFTVD